MIDNQDDPADFRNDALVSAANYALVSASPNKRSLSDQEAFEGLLQLVKNKRCTCVIGKFIKRHILIKYINDDDARRIQLMMISAAFGNLEFLKLLLRDENSPCTEVTIGSNIQGQTRRIIRRKRNRDHKKFVKFIIGEIECSTEELDLDSDGRSVLHHAVEGKQLDVILWITAFYIGPFSLGVGNMLTTSDSLGVSPLVAVAEQEEAIWRPVFSNFSLFLSFTDSDFELACRRASSEAKEFLVYGRNKIQFVRFWNSVQYLENSDYRDQRYPLVDVDMLKIEASRELNRSPRDGARFVPTPHEQCVLYGKLRLACASGNLELVKWMIDSWDCSIDPPDTANETFLQNLHSEGHHFDFVQFVSVVDCAVLGDSRFVGAVCTFQRGTNITGRESSFFFEDHEFAKSKPSFFFEDHEPAKSKKLNFLESHYPYTVFQNYKPTDTSNPFLSCLEEMAPDEPVYYRRRDDWFDARVVKAKQDRHEERLEVIKFCIEKFGQRFLPRLDLVIFCDAVQILEWMVSSGYIDMNAKVADFLSAHTKDVSEDLSSSDSVRESENQEEDVCAICLHDIKDPFELRCGHSFCIECLRGLFEYAVTESMESDDSYVIESNPFEGIDCPKCRRNVVGDLVQAVGVERRFVIDLVLKRIPTFDWWLEPNPVWTIGELIFMCAVGAGSLHCVQNLVNQNIVNVWTVRTITGHNAMRVAVSNKRAFIVKWLHETGFADLVSDLSPASFTNPPSSDASGLKINSFHAACVDGYEECFLYFNQNPWNYGCMDPKFLDSHGCYWITHALQSGNDIIIGHAEDWQRRQRVQDLTKLPQRKEPLAEIIDFLVTWKIVTKGSIVRLVDVEDYVFVTFLRSCVEFGRSDVLRWLYFYCFGDTTIDEQLFLHDRPRSEKYFPVYYANSEINADLTQKGTFVDGKLPNPRAFSDENCLIEQQKREVHEFFDIIDLLHDINQECTDMTTRIEDVMENGATVEEIVSLDQSRTNAFQEGKLRLDPDFHKFLDDSLGESFSWLQDITVKASKIASAVRKGHFHLVRWVLSQYSSDVKNQMYLLYWCRQPSIRNGDLELFVCYNRYIQEQGWPFDTVFFMEKSDHFDVDNLSLDHVFDYVDHEDELTPRPILHVAAASLRVSDSISDSESACKYEEKSKREEVLRLENAHKILIQILDHPEFKIDATNAVRSSKTSILHEYIRSVYGRCVGKQKEWLPAHLQFFTVFKLLVDIGVDVHAVAQADAFYDDKNRSVVDTLAQAHRHYNTNPCQEGTQDVLIQCIRYLKDVKNVDTSHLAPQVRELLKPTPEQMRELTRLAAENRRANP